MKTTGGALIAFLVFLLSPMLFGFFLYEPETETRTPKPLAQYDCESVFQHLTKEEDWFEQLVNPTLETLEQISERIDLYMKVYSCIGDDDGTLPYDLSVIRMLAEYFLIFAAGFKTPVNETSLVLLSLEQSNDKGIVRIRDEAGIAPPKGYIFVRFYTSKYAMPDLIYRAFQSEETAGVTFLTRYIAVLSEKGAQPQQELRRLSLPETVSHELVHAYINSILGLRGVSLPLWYHEGIAIFFSGSGKLHTTVSGDFVVYTTPPEEYQQYDANFKYLEAQFGRQYFLERIKRSVEEVNPEILYQDLDIESYQDLADRAIKWQKQQWIKKSVILVVVLIMILIIPYFLLGILPEWFPRQCPFCGYRGRERDFANGCPNCHRRLF